MDLSGLRAVRVAANQISQSPRVGGGGYLHSCLLVERVDFRARGDVLVAFIHGDDGGCQIESRLGFGVLGGKLLGLCIAADADAGLDVI